MKRNPTGSRAAWDLRADILEACRAGTPAAQVARERGCSRAYVYEVLKQVGVRPPRPTPPRPLMHDCPRCHTPFRGSSRYCGSDCSRAAQADRRRRVTDEAIREAVALFTWREAAELLGVAIGTIARRAREMGLPRTRSAGWAARTGGKRERRAA